MAGREADPPVPMSAVIANELELIGSHGMQAFEYPRMLHLIEAGRLNPARLISDRITLTAAAALLPEFDSFPGTGITVIDRLNA
jgi:alcohol dehydrogenase